MTPHDAHVMIAFAGTVVALDAKIRYVPAVATGHNAWCRQEPWRLIGRHLTQMVQMQDAVTYVIQPWTLTGHWIPHDRPLIVQANEVELWPEEVTPVVPGSA